LLDRPGQAFSDGNDMSADAAGGMDDTHRTDLDSWVESANGHPEFPIQNLPFGIFANTADSQNDSSRRGGIRIGDEILDLRALADSGLLSGAAQTAAAAASQNSLNRLFELGAEPRKALRARVSALLTRRTINESAVAGMLCAVADARPALPVTIGDYTDFYAGIHHATAVGELFRPEDPLPPNYKWVPIGYHGRASTVRPSGIPFRRPSGQLKGPDDPAPSYLPSRRLDFELELGVWVGTGTEQGSPVSIGRAAEHVAGYCLLNDWSTRDVQSWEYQPLGPFLAKNFATTVSTWVITPEALAPFRAAMAIRPVGDPAPLPYLDDIDDQRIGGLDLELEVLLSTSTMRADGVPPHRLALSSTEHMYWSVAQLLTHHVSGGCNLRPGDLLGTGTVSGPTDDGRGSLLELTHDGRDSIRLPTGEIRTFLEDGDEVLLRAKANRAGAVSIGFGECRAVVLPVLPAGPSTG